MLGCPLGRGKLTMLYCYLLYNINIFFVMCGYEFFFINYNTLYTYLMYSISDADIRKCFKDKLCFMYYKSSSLKSC